MFWLQKILKIMVLDYVVKQLMDLIEIVEEKFKLKFDEEKLVEAVKLSDKASELWLEALKLRSNKPCPLGGGIPPQIFSL